MSQIHYLLNFHLIPTTPNHTQPHPATFCHYSCIDHPEETYMMILTLALCMKFHSHNVTDRLTWLRLYVHLHTNEIYVIWRQQFLAYSPFYMTYRVLSAQYTESFLHNINTLLTILFSLLWYFDQEDHNLHSCVLTHAQTTNWFKSKFH